MDKHRHLREERPQGKSGREDDASHNQGPDADEDRDQRQGGDRGRAEKVQGAGRYSRSDQKKRGGTKKTKKRRKNICQLK